MKSFACLVAFAFLSCTTTSNMGGSNDADSYIRSANPRFADAFSRSDWTTVGSYYSDDAVFLMPNSDAIRGSAAIKQTLGTMDSMHPKLTLTTDRIVQSCDTAYEYGTYQMNMTMNGSPANDRGKYLTVWKRQPGGDWKIVADMINTSVPARGM